MSKKTRTLLNQKKHETINGWLFATPALVLLSLFLIGPFFLAVAISFTDLRLISPLPTEFVGLRNYYRLFSEPLFLKALLNNLKFAAVVVPLQTSFALILAVLVDSTKRGSYFFRLMYFMPVVVTMVVVSVIWYFMYNPSAGLINRFLNFLTLGNIGEVRWLESKLLALPAIIILSIWQGVGFQMVIYLAGLQNIPQSLIESSIVDGASNWQRFWRITFPLLKNTTIFIVVATTILAFQLFTQVMVMTGGGPEDSTQTTMIYMYTEGFKNLKVGSASAISVLFVIIVLIISLTQRLFIKSEKEVL